MIFRSRWDIPVCLFIWAVAMITFATNEYSTSSDSRWTVHIATSLLKEGNVDLNEYLAEVRDSRYYMVHCVTPAFQQLSPERTVCPPGSRYYSFYPLGTPVLAAPAVALIEKTVYSLWTSVQDYIRKPGSSQQAIQLLRGDIVGAHRLVEIYISACILALTACFLYATSRQYTGIWQSAMAAGIFAFCSPAWSTASRALWQHTPSMFMLSTALFLLVMGERNPAWVRMAGLPLSLAFFVRMTNAVPVAVLSIYVFQRYREQFSRYLLWALPATVCFTALNYSAYHSLIPPYTAIGGGLGLHANFVTALAGQLVSPARGLFVYSPVFLLSIAGVWHTKALRRYLIAILVLHWVLISAYPDWKGGWSIGPRYFSDLTPLLVYCLIPLISRGKLATSLILLLCVPSFWIHHRCATRPGCMTWNALPNEINQHEERLWDWRDPPFLR